MIFSVHKINTLATIMMLQGLSVKRILYEMSQLENKTTDFMYLFYLASSERSFWQKSSSLFQTLPTVLFDTLMDLAFANMPPADTVLKYVPSCWHSDCLDRSASLAPVSPPSYIRKEKGKIKNTTICMVWVKNKWINSSCPGIITQNELFCWFLHINQKNIVLLIIITVSETIIMQY